MNDSPLQPGVPVDIGFTTIEGTYNFTPAAAYNPPSRRMDGYDYDDPNPIEFLTTAHIGSEVFIGGTITDETGTHLIYLNLAHITYIGVQS